jgi:enoyl-CoA hydratase
MTELEVRQDGAVLTVLFNRPEARNAMTFAMYDGLEEACARADADDSVRVMVLRGAGGRAFVAGTDISQFATFTSGEDGIAYEERISRVVNRLEDVAVPTVAAIGGPAWAAASRWPPPATCGWRPSPRASACRSRGRSATACR